MLSKYVLHEARKTVDSRREIRVQRGERELEREKPQGNPGLIFANSEHHRSLVPRKGERPAAASPLVELCPGGSHNGEGTRRKISR